MKDEVAKSKDWLNVTKLSTDEKTRGCSLRMRWLREIDLAYELNKRNSGSALMGIPASSTRVAIDWSHVEGLNASNTSHILGI
jgi:hypothetical protein